MATRKTASATLHETPRSDGAPWYKDAVIYQLHVRSFADSNDDGIGDFRGLTERLDYLQDLGVTAMWLLPFYPSPLKDDGYDIASFTEVHPMYGTLRDFQTFLKAAHRRGLRVITELVLNHTSDRHAWFERARKSPPGSRWRNFYVWSDTAAEYADARVIFKDFESSNWTWDPVARQYYWHRFYSHQPDLNYDNAEVRRAMLRVVDFWMDLGVDGMRLDAVPYLYEREGTSCENLPETHAYLKELRAHVDRRHPDRMLLAEANQWPDDACAYFGDGDECHMAFHFPLMPRLFMATHQEDSFPIVDIMQQTPDIPENCQWAVFLRNHDELTLEMVTDEERDYMYRVYATDQQARINLGIRRRLAPLLGNNRRKIELMNGLLLSLPGTPVIYYGDEIGMGDNIYLGDRNGVRTPMQWSPDRNAGFSRANPQKLFQPVIIDPEYHYESVNVESQQGNQHSLLWWMKRLMALRKRHKSLTEGELEFLHPDNHKVLAFLRRAEGEVALVVANLSRFVQAVELDLSEFSGSRPVEMFGRTEFPAIGELPYFVTLGPHAFYWFAIELTAVDAAHPEGAKEELPVVRATASRDGVFSGRTKAAIESLLPAHIAGRRWFGGKSRRIRSAELSEVIPVGDQRAATSVYVAIARVQYTDGEPDSYMLPLALLRGDEAERVVQEQPHAVIARVEGAQSEGVICDATATPMFGRALLRALGTKRRVRGHAGELTATPTKALRTMLRQLPADTAPSVMGAEQSNTSLVFDEKLILKLFRRMQDGTNPDLEIGRHLTERARFPHAPAVGGAVEYARPRGPSKTLAILQEFVPNQGDAWHYTLDELGRFFEVALTEQRAFASHEVPVPDDSLLDLSQREPDDLAQGMIGAYLPSVRLLGQRTAELHAALASAADDADFAPEPFTPMYQRSLHQSWRSLASHTMQTLRKRVRTMPEDLGSDVAALIDREHDILAQYRRVLDRRIRAARIRVHGDFHLGQVLFTGKDFVIIDFEGEPARPFGERRVKRCALADVAGLLRSFDYAAQTARSSEAAGSAVREEDVELLEPWARFWRAWVSASYMRGYLEAARGQPFVPAAGEDIDLLLRAYLLDKGMYEIGYEMNNRPEWLSIPVRGVLGILAEER